MNYKDITIDEAESLYNNNINIICDADKKEIAFDSIVTDIMNNLVEAFKNIAKVINEIGNEISAAFNNIREYVLKIYDKKITKKKFIKLLQSYGVQRNNINKLIRNNKDKYTMWKVLLNIPPNL